MNPTNPTWCLREDRSHWSMSPNDMGKTWSLGSILPIDIRPLHLGASSIRVKRNIYTPANYTFTGALGSTIRYHRNRRIFAKSQNFNHATLHSQCTYNLSQPSIRNLHRHTPFHFPSEIINHAHTVKPCLSLAKLFGQGELRIVAWMGSPQSSSQFSSRTQHIRQQC